VRELLGDKEIAQLCARLSAAKRHDNLFDTVEPKHVGKG
jgi:hypothetical protein